MDNLTYAFILTILAGLATGVGSMIAFIAHKINRTLISFLLGLSAGLMVYVSFVELFPFAQETMVTSFGEKLGLVYTALSFFGGIALISIIDFLVPHDGNPHEIRSEDEESNPRRISPKLKRMGIMTALAIAIHNFPEGISTFITAYESPTMGFAIAVAIALHNIPEGIAVSVPIYYSTGSKQKAFWYSFLSGLAEPLGAFIAFMFLMPYINDVIMSICLAAAAGIMVYVSIDELLPAAHEYGKHHASILGFIAGMIVMCLTMILL